MINPPSLLRSIVARVPAVVPYLRGRARWAARTFIPLPGLVVSDEELGLVQFDYRGYKTYDYFLQNLERLITSVYNGNVGGEFIDVMANLISGQLTQAYEQAWTDEEGLGSLPGYLSGPLEDMILSQYDFVDSFYREIVDARVDGEPLEPLIARAANWARQWDVAYQQAALLIRTENGGNLIWVKGNTEQGCATCAALDGIIAPASVWEELGVHPRGYPNSLLECEGGGPVNNCDCELKPTDQRRSPKAYDSIMSIVSK